MFVVAIIFAPNTFSIIISFTFIGNLHICLFIISIHSNTLSFGIGLSVLTGKTFPFSHLIVEVTILSGLVHSLTAYFAPRGHVFPVTLKTLLFSSNSTSKLQQ